MTDPQALAQGATARPHKPLPWDWEYGVSQRTAWALVDAHNKYVLRWAVPQDITTVPDPEDDMDFLLYAVNHIEQAEAERDEALALLRALVTNPWGVDIMSDPSEAKEARAFLRRHDAQPGERP